MLFKFAAIASALVASVSAHMTIIDPCPRFSPWCTHEPPALPAGVQYDYSIKSPIDPASTLLCKSNTSWPSPVATWTAGQSITVQFYPDGAAHGGGHAQFSVSYDGGNTFAVVYEVLKYMFFNGPSSSNTPEVLSYTFTLPADLPNSDSVIFAWSWVNAIGNREFYMNCADVAITGSSSSSYTGKQMVIADHDGYPTIPAFNGDYTTGLSYYENAPSVTVSPSGYTAASVVSSGANYAASPVASSSAVYEASSTATPVAYAAQGDASSALEVAVAVVSSAPAAAEPTTAAADPASDAEAGSDTESDVEDGSSSSACTHGTLACTADGAGYQACVWGVWSVVINCPTETACKPFNNSILCDWA
ncbi:hypothetical protein EV175_002734 [Coemansia sp. RSA 1933]|nr:hypothetical protein EV175_002734 [Coemansia sp. RSA 1933]